MPIYFNRLLTVFIALSISACNVTVQAGNTATAAPLIVSVTLPATSTLRPSDTPLPPPPQPTIVPVEGTTSTQLNVRAEPSTVSDVLGVIRANTKVQIVGTDPDENWWQIIYEMGVDGKGWVTAQYVETAGRPQVPVLGGGGLNSGSATTAVVIQQLNIRSGPGTSFNSLGTLNTNDIVNLTGKNSNGTWFQIEFPTGPDGKGWVSSGFVNADNAANLPIASDAGDVIGTGTPADTPLPPTPTIAPAAMDFDSADAPVKTVIFNRTGTNAFIYNGDVSTPNGDTEDWIAFTPYDNLVFIDIQCNGSNTIRVELNNIDTGLLCAQTPMAITVSANSASLLHILAVPSTNQLTYTQYTITIKENP